MRGRKFRRYIIFLVIGFFIGVSIFPIINGNIIENSRKIVDKNKINSTDVDLEPNADAYIWEILPTDNFGKKETLYVCSVEPDEMKSFIKFDLDNIPSNTRIYHALLDLKVRAYSNDPFYRDINCNRVTESWNEITIKWNNAPEYDISRTGYDKVPYDPMGKWMEWEVTDDVQQIVYGQNDNYGWVILDPNPQPAGGSNIGFYSREESDSDNRPKLMINTYPNQPTISGPSRVSPGSYDYKFTSTDFDGDDVRIHIDWGDGDDDVTGFKDSGSTITESHTWGYQGTFMIRAKAENPNGAESYWNTFTVSVPTNKIVNSYIEHLMERFPVLYDIFQRFLSL